MSKSANFGVGPSIAAISLASFVASGCASNPVNKPESREQWEEIHVKTYRGYKPNDLLMLAEKILKSSDKDFEFDYPPGELIARRNWFFYAVLAAASGQDVWKVESHETESGTQVVLRASRQVTGHNAAPVIGLGGGISGVTPQSNSMPGSEIFWPGPFRLFWSRMDYALGLRSDWVSCDEAIQASPADFNEWDVGVLCGATTDEKITVRKRKKSSDDYNL